MILILDLDGVLITTPPWKPDDTCDDGYSAFNDTCVENLNRLLTHENFDIWLSSSRRRTKTLDEFNAIFANRNVKKPISGFIPECADCQNRKDEIVTFLQELNTDHVLIIDDDSSLNDLPAAYKRRLVLTEAMKGFDKQKLVLAKAITDQLKTK